MTKYLIDLQRNKILDPKKSIVKTGEHKNWSDWVRSGRAKFFEANVIPEVAVFDGTNVVEDAQKRQKYDNDQADIQALKNTQMSDITTATLVQVVKLVVRVLKSKL